MKKTFRTVKRRFMQHPTLAQPDAGMSTAEYAVGTLAAAAFAMVLYKIVTSSAVSSALAAIVHRALNMAF